MKISNIVSGMLNFALIAGLIFWAVQAQAITIRLQYDLDFETQLECIAQNIYHEARNESELGMRAVAWVTLNRVQSSAYPTTACDVVFQAKLDGNGNPIKNKCQFSWFCDGKTDTIANQEKWALAVLVAADVMRNYSNYPDPTGNAIMYHANYVKPAWASDYKKVVSIDAHIFYTEKVAN